MQKYLIMCRSITQAQRVSRLLERSGLTAVTRRAPLELTGSGCGHCVIVRERDVGRALALIRDAGIQIGKIYSVYPEYEEAPL